MRIARNILTNENLKFQIRLSLFLVELTTVETVEVTQQTRECKELTVII